MSKNRIKTAYKNSIITFLSQIVMIVLGFAVRRVFIDSLGVTYLGYNSVFQNILQALNLAELGIGVSITSFLYRPLAHDDEDTIIVLMSLYKKMYRIVGGCVLAFGIILSIFLGILIPDAKCSIWELRGYFYIYLSGTVSSYFMAYKRTLMMADQKAYVNAEIDAATYVLTSVVQIIILFVAPTFGIFAALSVIKVITSNLIISCWYEKEYKNLRHKSSLKSNEDGLKKELFSNMKDVYVSRIGAYVYYGTDNIIISLFKGSMLAGYFSNYTLVTTQVLYVVNQLLSSIQSTFGNFIFSSDKIDEQRKIADGYICLNYCIGNFCMFGIIFLIQPFIELVFGKAYVMSNSTVILLGITLFLSTMIQIPSQIFIIFKLFRYDKPIIIISAFLNILISALLVINLGVDGVLIGTIITSLFYLFSRLYIICSRVFSVSFRHYSVMLLRYLFYSIITAIFLLMGNFKFADVTLFSFIIRLVLVILITSISTVLLVSYTAEYFYVIDKIIPRFLRVYLKKKNLMFVLIILMGLSYFFSYYVQT